MSAETDIYDFETAIEDAVEALMLDNDLEVVTPRTAEKFQKARPRLELLFKVHGAKQSYHVVENKKRNATWAGELTVAIVTGTGETDSENVTDSSQVHREYRARVRNLMATAADDLNGNDDAGDRFLAFHQVQNVVESGNVPKYGTDKGYEMSTLSYQIDFGVHKDAWTALTT